MIKLFIQKHTAVFAFTILIIVLGIFAYATLPRESNPEIKQPYIFITTTYLGVSAEDIESLVTEKIENELDGLEGIVELTSESRQNSSFIFVEFSSDVEVSEALQRTKDRVDIAKSFLPDDADDPYVREFSVSNWSVFTLILSHPEGVAIIDEAAELAEEEIKRISGVLDVEVSGRLEREVAIDLDPYRMGVYNLSINNISQAINQEHIVIPGGTLESEARNYTLAVSGEITDLEDFKNIVISSSMGVQVPLSEVANIEFRESENQSRSRLNGQPSITLGVKRRMGGNILDLSAAIKARLSEIEGQFPEGTDVYIAYDESESIQDMLFDLENNMASGFVLVLLVTILFLGMRNSLFVSLAIPLSMLLSFFVLQMMGITLNMIVLFSLILALGMLVDNGIVIVENIYRHRAMGKSKIQGAIDGTKEVAGAIIASTITTLLAFFPILFMPGVIGDFMSYVPITIIVVLSSSLFVALAINPVFCAQFLKISEKQRLKMESGGGGFAKFQDWYMKILRGSLKHSFITVMAIFVLVFMGIGLFVAFSADIIFFPTLDPERARVTVEAPQGTPVNDTDQVVSEIEGIIPGVPSSMRSIRAVSGSGGGNSHKGSVDVTFTAYNERTISGEEAIRNYKAALSDITDAKVTVEARDNGPPSGNDISFEVRGEDYQIMGEITQDIMNILEPHQEVFKEYDNDFEASQQELKININRERAAQLGLSTAQIASSIRTAINGSNIGSFRSSGEEYDIVLRYQKTARDSLQMLRNVQVVSYSGQRIALSAVADITPQSSVGVIKSRNLNRAVNIWADFDLEFEGREGVISEINAQVETLKASLPAGYEIGSGAGSDIRDESSTFLIQAFMVAVFLIFIVLIALFNSLSDPLIIMIAVVLSMGGVFWGFLITGMSFVIIMSGIGCIALAGVAVNNCIVLVDYTHKLIKDGMPWREAVIESGRVRLRPVILTALTTVLALVPMAFGVSFDIHTFQIVTGSESAEYWKAFAWTMLFGLTFATVSTLVIVPAMMHLKYRAQERMSRFRAKRSRKKEPVLINADDEGKSTDPEPEVIHSR